jgi:hypothetical protein
MLDPNLVAAVWGTAALYGVLVSILIIRTDQIYQEYMKTGSELFYHRAKTWVWTTRLIPAVAFVTILGLSLIAIFGPNSVPIKSSTSFWVVFAGVVTMAIFIGIVFRLVRPLPPFELPPISCADGGKLSSFDTSRTLTKITFINRGTSPVQYVWIDRHGDEREKFRVALNPDGTPQVLETWAGHLWMVQDSEHKCLVLYRAREVPGGVTIK